MFIDTRSRESMGRSMSTYLSISVDELYRHINCAAEKAQKEEIGTIISDLQPEIEIDELLFFHFSRRLHGTEDDVSGRNLEELLTTRNAFSDFLRKHEIIFIKGEQNIITYYKEREVDWDKCGNGNRARVKCRLGYVKDQEDYCFNGFAFKDPLYKTEYAHLYLVPEIIGDLAACLGCKGLESDYRKNSSFYCFEYKVPIDRVIFDGHDDFSYSQKKNQIVYRVLERLLQ